jgi:hypothetical protein
MDKWHCPICDREITDMECFDIALVVEESSPPSELPSFITEEDAKAKRRFCLHCEYHPQ